MEKQEKIPKEEEHMEEVMARWGPFLRYILSSVLTDRTELEECYGEVLLRIWQKRDQYEEEKGAWKSWMAAIARNTALNWNRSRKAAEPLPEHVPSNLEEPEDFLLRKERQEMLRKAVLGLSPMEQQLFYRKYYYCQSAAQIAAELGITERAVEGRLYRMKGKLRRLLGGKVL